MIREHNIEHTVSDDRSKYFLQVILLVLFFLLSFPILMTEYNIIYVAVVTFYLILYFLYRLIRIKQVTTWEKTPCKIDEYKIIQHKRYDQDNNPSLDYEVSIAYSYHLGGVDYKSKQVGIDKSQYLFKEKMFEDDAKVRDTSIDYLQAILKRTGSHAYVNRNKPKDAVLDNEISTEGMLRWLGYLLLSSLMFVAMIYLGVTI